MSERQIRKNRRFAILTPNGKPEAVLRDADAYQRLLDIAAQADEHEGIRQGLEDARLGRIRPAKEIFRRVRAPVWNTPLR